MYYLFFPLFCLDPLSHLPKEREKKRKKRLNVPGLDYLIL